jgi:hypothetical protein
LPPSTSPYMIGRPTASGTRGSISEKFAYFRFS